MINERAHGKGLVHPDKAKKTAQLQRLARTVEFTRNKSKYHAFCRAKNKLACVFVFRMTLTDEYMKLYYSI